jgi:putative hydrolase
MTDGGHLGVALDQDFHVHSTFSDGASTLAENVGAARDRGLRTLCLVDHVRRDTGWLPEFTAAVAQLRQQEVLRGQVGPLGQEGARDRPGLRILAGVEAKILDCAGRLDLPSRLDGIDLVLIADHQFPGDDGPVHPVRVRERLGSGAMTAAEAIARLCEATANAARATDRPCMLAHLFSVLPKVGLDEAMVPGPLLASLASQVAEAGAMIEINEKWECPSARTVAALARTGMPVVAGSDSHHCRDVGVYRSVRLTACIGVFGPDVL